VPPPQPPFVHVPAVPEHALPEATHFFALLSQQPPALQMLPSQQGSPAAPQAPHLGVAPGMQAKPDPVQKFAATPAPPGLPGQQAWPLPPHGVVAQPPLAVLHAPRLPPHDVLLPRQTPSTQQSPPPQALSWQQALPVAPQAFCVPLTHTSPAVGVFSPLA
jgi:hypothetical protein